MNFQLSLRANAIIGLVIGSVVGGFVGHMVLCWVIGVGLAILASNIRFWAIVLAPIVYILDLINTPPTEDRIGINVNQSEAFFLVGIASLRLKIVPRRIRTTSR